MRRSVTGVFAVILGLLAVASVPHDGTASDSKPAARSSQAVGKSSAHATRKAAQRPGSKKAVTKKKPAKIDPVELEFVFVGCNRLQNSDWDKHTNPSSANLVQLQQTFADIASISPLPTYFFFTGDLVLNLAADDGKTLKDQLDAWVEVYDSDPSDISAKTTLVPLPGNHEMLQEIKEASGPVPNEFELPNQATDDVWLKWLNKNGFDKFAGNGPTNSGGNPNQLVDDQSKLTYSFDSPDGSVHFVVLNTDTSNIDVATGWIALNWIMRDISKAQRNKRIKSIFVFGHKPMFVPNEEPGGYDTILYPLNYLLFQVFRANPKVKAYLCAHAHQWDATKIGGSHFGVWQVIAGNGGSELDSNWNPVGGPYFGFTRVKLYKSGRVGVLSYRRPVPTPFYYSGPTQKAVAQPEIFLDN